MKKKLLSFLMAAVIVSGVAFAGNAFAPKTLAASAGKGDVNLDGKINVSDCVLIKMIIAGDNEGLSPTQLNHADVDYNGKVDKTDATILSEYILKIRKSLPSDPDDDYETGIIIL